MRIVIYNSSSFGGCFDYGRALTQAYAQNPEIEQVSWWVPTNTAETHTENIKRIFLSDKPSTQSKIGKQLFFLWRVLVNPIKLGVALRKSPPSWVIFNDFEQLSAIVWVPLFRFFLSKKHRFAIVLHDPDRDAYPPSLWFTRLSMNKIMGLMDMAIYHDFLPEKPYYQAKILCKFIDLPHGFYSMPEADLLMVEKLACYGSPDKTMMAILGNIRPEKNYHLAIEALKALPNHLLVIAGCVANARVNLQTYKDLADNLKVSSRVIWIEKFMTEAEMAAVIESVDVVLLNYASSFTSQSGILNVVAPFRKELIVSDGPSSLSSILKRFKVGELVETESVQSLINGLKKLEAEELEVRQNWEDYLQYASWDNHVSKAIEAMKSLERNT